MHHYFRLPLLLLLTGLAGCATRAPPSVPQRQPMPPSMVARPPSPQPSMPSRQSPAVPPQSSATAPFFTQTGLASFYGRAHAGKRTASGEKFDHREFTAAHRTLAFGTLVRVTNLANGRTVTVEITDRGPRLESRIIDLSFAAAGALDMQNQGIARVKLEAFRQDQAGPG